MTVEIEQLERCIIYNKYNKMKISYEMASDWCHFSKYFNSSVILCCGFESESAIVVGNSVFSGGSSHHLPLKKPLY